MAGVFRIKRPFLFQLEFRPVEQESKLRQLGVLGESPVKSVHFCQAVVSLEAAAGHVLEHKLLSRQQDAHLLLLREMVFRIESALEPQIDKPNRLLGKRNASVSCVE